jgi:paraquat-inducible protein A
VIPGIGMFATGALVFLLPWLASTFDSREVWRRIAWVSREAR